MSLSPYLYFDGHCAEAFEFYKSVFGGDFGARMTYADGPPDMGVPDNEKDRIMHVSLGIGDTVLMGSDSVSAFGDPAKPANSFAISYSPKSKEEADKIFASLKSNGGAESMPMSDAFWGSYFGMCKDRFGVHWMVNFDTSSDK